MRIKALSLVLPLILFWQSAANADMAISPIAATMNQIAYSKDLTVDQKTEQLLPYLDNPQWRHTAVYYLTDINPKVGFDRGIAIFRDVNVPRPDRIKIGKLLLTGRNPTRPEFPKSFIPEYASYLKELALNGDEQKFMTKNDGLEPNAIEEMASWAAGHNGYAFADFPALNDPKLIPVLINCLDAPDNVYPQDQGDVIWGKPGDSSGDNNARNLLPFALAKLHATQAVPKLRTLLRKSPSWSLRDSAAYALATLEDPSEHAAIIQEMKNSKPAQLIPDSRKQGKSRFSHLYTFGKGLIQRGDDTGLELMQFEYAMNASAQDRSSFRYMISQRLEVLKDFRSPKMDELIAQYWADPRVVNFWLVNDPPLTDHEKAWMTPPPATGPASQPADTQRQEMFDTFCTIIENNLAQSIPALEIIARDSGDPVIRQRAAHCIDVLTIKS